LLEGWSGARTDVATVMSGAMMVVVREERRGERE